jgi:hypothetical protein
MLLKIAFVLLIAWLVGVLGLNRIGDLVHVVLMVGLMLLLLARDAAVARGRDVSSGKIMSTRSTSISFCRYVPR